MRSGYAGVGLGSGKLVRESVETESTELEDEEIRILLLQGYGPGITTDEELEVDATPSDDRETRVTVEEP